MVKPNEFRLIGLTGPTGAGKSTVAALFAARGVPVIDADDATRAVQAVGSPCLAALAEAFGADILQEDGTLNRPTLAMRAFADKAATERLNAVTHPFILEEMNRRTEAAKASGAAVAVFDAPLLFEAKLEHLCHTTVAVLAAKELRLARIMMRDRLDEQAASRRMAVQPADAFYRERAAHIVENNGDTAALAAMVDRILAEVRR